MIVERGARVDKHLDALVAAYVAAHGGPPWEAALGMAGYLRATYPAPVPLPAPTGWAETPES